MKWTAISNEIYAITIMDICYMNKLSSPTSLLNKAKRQEWPYEEMHGPGKPVHHYSLQALPDDIQTAWAAWDELKYREAVEEEVEKGRTEQIRKIPKPITLEHAKEVLKWHSRSAYYKLPDKKNLKKGATFKKYDGISKGLCIDAAIILKKRFPELNNTDLPTIQPELPPKRTWNVEVPFDQIRRDSKICTNCEFGDYIENNMNLEYCPHCECEEKLISHCPECGVPIVYPYANRCTKCRTIFRKRPAPLPK